MEIMEVLSAIWRRRFVFLAALALTVGVAALSLSFQKPTYKSTSTLGLSPSDQQNSLFLFGQVTVIIPLYREAATAVSTRELAQSKMQAPLGRVSVRTFPDAPVFKVDVSAPTPEDAQKGAESMAEALLERSRKGEIGVVGLSLLQIDRPDLPESPVSPQPKLTFAVAVVIGIGLGVAASWLVDSRRRKVETADVLADAAGAPCFAEIPYERAIPALGAASFLFTDRRLRVVSEAFRDLRTNLQFAEEGLSSIVVTSPQGRHGKTTVSLVLAATMARAGLRTVLVDGDMYQGRVADALRVRPSPGFLDLLKGRPLEGLVQPTDLPNLYALTAGRPVSQPSELLESSFVSVLKVLEDSYEVVVVDGPPLVPVNDARIMARFTQASLIVVSAGSVTWRQVRSSAERLEMIDVIPTATVLNNVRTRRPAGYYAYLEPRNSGHLPRPQAAEDG